ncbi:cytochrome b/b6 domain-containing protein [Defluviimonas sp. D31]|uniref:cytochrome b/b6 domain-containing protein n=1 Tax=Defluviimonas sp. D31 TaxID=3083253 RepID=UPI00296F07E3|nr:cytochrome b/b6 domain-containing protein [Defluviimonas sp. D31]MDW4550658.1 cytochrome b/b6 domain-containing protein [Defluviimonas sp. D31]
MPTALAPTKHSFATRLAHIGLALAVLTQLGTSQVMEPVEPGSAGNAFFTLHEYAGLAAFAFVLGFWMAATFRRRGTAWGLLLPWFSGARLAALWADSKAHLGSLTRFRIPVYDAQSPLASAVHGLGLLLMTAMAGTGTVYYAINAGNPDAGGLVGLVMFVHTSLANLVWAYLIGHGTLALIHHFTQNLDLREMWSLSRDGTTGGSAN